MEDYELFDLSSLKNKKRQHYVSKFYLDLWLTNKKLHALRLIDGKEYPFEKAETADIAIQNYFYNLEMDSVVWDALNYIFEHKSATNPFIKKFLQDTFFFKAADDVLNKGIGVVKEIPEMKENAQEILRHLKKHHLEDAYASIESAVSAEIKAFSNSQADYLFNPPTTRTFQHLLVFYCFQIFRTRQKINEIGEYMSTLHLESDHGKITLTDVQKQALLKCILYINSYEFCQELEKAGCIMRISVNKTELDFITTDCPAMYFAKTDSVPEYKAYGLMPLSPRLFMNICIPHEPSGGGSLLIQNMETIDEVRSTNKLIKSRAYEFVFSTQKLN
ncbi:UNVERIFIED_ORG: hypothetical protein J2W82_001359 [Pseudomonas mohnii]|nr:hypothetical protein [Pseudomonas mohnii]